MTIECAGPFLTPDTAALHALVFSHRQTNMVLRLPWRATFTPSTICVCCNTSGTRLAIAEEARREWPRHWIAFGFDTIERMLASRDSAGSFCHGDNPTLADCSPIPQVFNALRVKSPLERRTAIRRIYEHCI